MIRSWLFVPGDSSRKMERAFGSSADALVFDWEDAVAPANKAAARALLPGVLDGAARDGPRLYVRVNGLDTPFLGQDLDSLPLERIAGVMLPKSCGPEDVMRLSQALAERERRAGLAENSLEIVAIATESAASVLALSGFRRPLPRLKGMLWGGEDLAADLGLFRNRDENGSYRPPFLLARNLMLFAAAATQSQAIDAVFTDFRDLEALERECREARRDGFGGKAAIHPDQVPVINAVFTPESAELDWARRIRAALEAGGGVGVLDGKMIDAPHLRLAEKLLGSVKG